MSAVDPSIAPVEYLNTTAAACSEHRGQRIDDGYRFLVKFFRSALIDRTETLQPGFEYRVLDPIPKPRAELPALAQLCNSRGVELLEEALSNDRELHVLWSGGIDSSAALVALIKAAENDTTGRGLERIKVFYSRHSQREHPRFFQQIIKPRLQRTKVRKLVDALDPKALIVTGEHGDQIFGSVLAGEYISERRWLRRADKRLLKPWKRVFSAALRQHLTRQQALQAERILHPQLARSPVPLETLFDLLWWVNFSMKWQPVTLRMAMLRPPLYQPLTQSLRHFFRSDDFQRWSLAHHSEKIGDRWASYKMPLKRYINGYFHDPDYLQNKLKQPSLSGVVKTVDERSFALAYSYEVVIEKGRGDSCADDGGE